MQYQNQPATLVGDREMIAVRFFDAPRDLVFSMWTDPRHISQWWGPRGFVTTTYSMEVKTGGVWRFVMHGPDGRDYENKVTYLEVDAPKKLVYKHGGDKDVEPVQFKVEVTFDEVDDKTKITWRMIFPSANARDYVMKTHGAQQGLTETIGRLVEMMETNPADRPFIISHIFDVPRELVWKAWSDRESLMSWFGPKGFTMSHADLDFRPGGTFHYCLRGPDGKEMWGKFVYRDIVPMQRIVLVNSFSDEKGGITRHPLSPTWPQQMLSTTTFAEHEGKTIMTIYWQPLNPTQVERDTFDAGRGGMSQGWTGTFEQLAEYLQKVQA